MIIEQLKQTIREKYTNEEGLVDIGKYDHHLLDEIVTSTYLQAVEDCVVHMQRKGYDRKFAEDFLNYQSLKQTKDVQLKSEQFDAYTQPLEDKKEVEGWEHDMGLMS